MFSGSAVKKKTAAGSRKGSMDSEIGKAAIDEEVSALSQPVGPKDTGTGTTTFQGHGSSGGTSAPPAPAFRPAYKATCSTGNLEDATNPPKLEPQWSFGSKGAQRRASQSKGNLLSGAGGFFGRRTEWVTMGDLEEVVELLKSDIGNTKAAIEFQVESMQESWKVTISTLTENVLKTERNVKEKLSTVEGIAQKVTETCCQNLEVELSKAIETVERDAHEKIESETAELEKAHAEQLEAMSSELATGLSTLRSDLAAQLGRISAEATSAGQERARLSSEAEMLQIQISQLRSEQAAALRGALEESAASQEKRCGALELQHQETSASHGAQLEQMTLLLSELQEDFVNTKASSQALLSNTVSMLQDSHGNRLNCLEEEMESMRVSVSETCSIPTRKVEWTVHGLSNDMLMQRDDQLSPARKWISPNFEIAGASNMQLSLQLLEADDEDGCDCELSLWGHDCDVGLVCKLYVGSLSWQCHHTFSERDPCCTRRIRAYAEQAFSQDEPVRIGVEVLEAIRNKTCCKDEEDTLVFYQHVNHSLLDLVREQVELMRSRMTRRVEWRLEQASLLRRCFAEGESLCSSTFTAAGLEGLQLVFYPSGYPGAKEFFCSLFLFYPGGSALRCWLSAGKQRREARIAFVEEPGFFGRTNFCRFDGCIDSSDDSVLLALEIEEVEQNVCQTLSHGVPRGHANSLPPPRDQCESRSEQRSMRSTPQPTTRSPTPNAVESVVKLQRLPGKMALEDVKQLPSIWTPIPVANVGDVLEGFHKFSDMKPRAPRKPHPGRQFRNGAYDPYGSGSPSLGFETPGPSVASSRPASRNDTRVLQKYMPYAQ